MDNKKKLIDENSVYKFILKNKILIKYDLELIIFELKNDIKYLWSN